MGGQFPELKAQQALIEKVIEEEEASFLRTLATGISLLDGVVEKTKKEGRELISGKDAFELYDTFGFPIDLTELIAREQASALTSQPLKPSCRRRRSVRATLRPSIPTTGWSCSPFARASSRATTR